MNGSRVRMQVSLNTPEKEAACLRTLAIVAAMARDLAEMPMAKNISGATAMQAFVGIINDMIETIRNHDEEPE